jgi:hypothetical protein
MAVTIPGRQFWLWRAVDHEGEVLDLLVRRQLSHIAGASIRTVAPFPVAAGQPDVRISRIRLSPVPSNLRSWQVAALSRDGVEAERLIKILVRDLVEPVEREMRNSACFRTKDPWFLRRHAKLKRQLETVVRLVMKRASKTNSWNLATLEERMDHLRRCHWRTISRDFPPEFVQSECCFKSIFCPWLRIEPTEEENQAFLTTAREVFLSLQ